MKILSYCYPNPSLFVFSLGNSNWSYNDMRNQIPIKTILALDQTLINEKLTMACTRALKKFGKRCQITLEWIKSHVGHAGNELADAEAKQGAIDGLLDEGVDLPKSHLKYKIKIAFEKIWENEWLNRSNEKRDFDYRQSKLWIKSYRKDISEEIGDLPREVASQVIGLITGHCNVRYHLRRTKPDLYPTSVCRLCENETEDAFHIVFKCPRIRVERAQSFGFYDIEELDKTRWKVKQLVTLLNNSSIRDMLKYNLQEENSRTTQD